MSLPDYSQKLDVLKEGWSERACGAVSLAILLEGISGAAVATPDELIDEGLAQGAYKDGVGWLHRGLAGVAEGRGFVARNYDWSTEDPIVARQRLSTLLQEAPVIASMRKGFSSDSGHLVVVSRLSADAATVHDPHCDARELVRQEVPLARFYEYWTQRVIVARRQGSELSDFSGE